MKRILIVLVLIFIQCSSSIHLQPHIIPINNTPVIDVDAGVYIPSDDLVYEYEKFNLFAGRTFVMPVGTSLKELTQETFASLFRKVFYVGKKDYEATPNIIEVKIINFVVTSGFDTHILLKCQYATKEEILFSEVFKGSGSGSFTIGIMDDKGQAKEKIRQSAEAAFRLAFQEMQIAFVNQVNNKNGYTKIQQ